VFSDESWQWEILGLVVSFISLMATVAILFIWNDKTPPSWSYGITINSLISWLSMIAKTSMLLSTAEGLSQLKWIRAAKRKATLADMEYLDRSSRGPWGSFALLVRFRGG